MTAATTAEELNALALDAKADPDKLPAVWEAVKGLAYYKANRYNPDTLRRHGLEYDDIVQSCAEAALFAVKTYTPGNSSFSTWAFSCFRYYTAELFGRTEKQKREPMNTACSLDTPVGEDAAGDTLGDFIPAAGNLEDDTAAAIDRQEIQTAVRAAVDQLPEAQRDIIQAVDLDGQTITAAAAERHQTAGRTQATRQAGLRRLHNNRRLFDLWKVDLYRPPSKPHSVEILLTLLEDK